MSAKLIACPDCHAEVSARAAACPKCGAPISRKAARTNRAGARWEGIGFVLIMVGLASLFSGSAYWTAAGMLAGLIGFVVFIIGRFK